ncbi:hypothetical protein GPL09_16525 [Bacteroides thetaiotaomicron]|nr:hypothetical protein [Bacteroides thetaiotaomicron]
MKEIKRDTNTRILFGRNSKKTYICHVIFFIVLDLRLTKVGARRCSFFYAPTFLYFTSEIYYCHSSTVIDYFFGFPQI